MFSILLQIIAISIALITLIMIIFMIVQRAKESVNHRVYLKKKKKFLLKAKEEDKQIRKAAPAKLQILLQGENKLHFENFVLLLDRIEWPEYPESTIDKVGKKIDPSIEAIEDYEDDFDEALDEEDRMYDLYVHYLKSKNIQISESELTHVVELYKKNNFNDFKKKKRLDLNYSSIAKNIFPKKSSAWHPLSEKKQKKHKVLEKDWVE